MLKKSQFTLFFLIILFSSTIYGSNSASFLISQTAFNNYDFVQVLYEYANKKNEACIVRENFNQENIVGYGYPIPYLDNLIKKNSNYLCLMPKSQGALNWPSKKNKTIMVEQTEWPLESEISDIAMIVHGLENCDNPSKLLEEAWRVLVPEGHLFIVVPNRTGFWARSDSTPFGYGKPYSISQLTALLRKNQFQIDSITPNLYGFPAKRGYWLKSLYLWEKLGKKLNSFFLGGLLIVEARKDVYAVKNVKSSKVSGYFRAVKVPVSTMSRS